MMDEMEMVERYTKADEETRKAVLRVLNELQKYVDPFDGMKGGDIDAKELTKLILERT